MPDEFVFVVDRALADPDIDAALAEVVEEGELDGKADRVVKRQRTTAKPIRIRSVRIAMAEANSNASL